MNNEHVFISYVQEDSPKVFKIADILASYGVNVWLDKNKLKPGQRWKKAIREAISNGIFFIACFSKAYLKKHATYMNEELLLAIEQLRLRQDNSFWFIPVKIDDCEIPDFDISPATTLSDLQWLDLSSSLEKEVIKLLEVIHPSFSEAEKYADYLLNGAIDERRSAVMELKKIKLSHPKVISALISATQDRDIFTSSAAKDILRKLDFNLLYKIIIDYIPDDTPIKKYITTPLPSKDLTSESLFSMIVDNPYTSESGLRCTAIKIGIIFYRHTKDINILHALLQTRMNGSTSEMMEALFAISEFGESVTEELISIMLNSDEIDEIRVAAIEAVFTICKPLESVTVGCAKLFLESDKKWHMLAINGMTYIGREGIPFLSNALNQTNNTKVKKALKQAIEYAGRTDGRRLKNES